MADQPIEDNELINQVYIEAFERIGQLVHHAVKDLSEHELAFRPEAHGNSIAWLVWHLARVQDSHLAELRDAEEVWTAGARSWQQKFDLPFEASATGYGHSSEEVDMVQASSALLVGYYDAVQKATHHYLSQLRAGDYTRVVDPSWDPPVTLLMRLVSVISDDLQHVGQAMYVRGLLERTDD